MVHEPLEGKVFVRGGGGGVGVRAGVGESRSMLPMIAILLLAGQ